MFSEMLKQNKSLPRNTENDRIHAYIEGYTYDPTGMVYDLLGMILNTTGITYDLTDIA